MAVNGGPTVIGEAIYRARKSRGWSQETLGGKIGTDQTTISQIERGIFRPKYDTVLRLADAFGIAPEGWVELAGYRTTGEERVSDPGALPAPLVEALEEMICKYPGLRAQMEARRGDPDFPGQVADLARVLGIYIKGWIDDLERPGEGI